MSVHTKKARTHRRELQRAERRLMREFNSLSADADGAEFSERETEILIKLKLIRNLLGQI